MTARNDTLIPGEWSGVGYQNGKIGLIESDYLLAG